MADPTYLIAKYVPDPKRMEPRNIGVILWSRGGVDLRFLEADEAHFIDDKKMYSRWVAFWTKTCREGVLSSEEGKTITARSRDFLNALIETQRGNYRLYEGGFILDDIRAKERVSAVDYLYHDLIAVPGASSDELQEPDSLAAKCDALFDEVGLSDREELKPGYTLDLDTEGISAPFRFDYAWENGSLGALFLRVNLSMQPSTTNAAFLFEHVQHNPKARNADRFAIVSGVSSDEKRATVGDKVEVRKRVLSKLSHVIDVNDVAEFRRVVEPLLLQAG